MNNNDENELSNHNNDPMLFGVMRTKCYAKPLEIDDLLRK
jgi:hypothetical protein